MNKGGNMAAMVVVSPKFQIVIPKELRVKLGPRRSILYARQPLLFINKNTWVPAFAGMSGESSQLPRTMI